MVLVAAGYATNLAMDLMAYRSEYLALGQATSETSVQVIAAAFFLTVSVWMVLLLLNSIGRVSVRPSGGWRLRWISLIRGVGNFWVYGVGVTIVFSSLLKFAQTPDPLIALALLGEQWSPLNWGNYILITLLMLPAFGLWKLAETLEQRPGAAT
jgi:hypothetical protein